MAAPETIEAAYRIWVVVASVAPAENSEPGKSFISVLSVPVSAPEDGNTRFCWQIAPSSAPVKQPSTANATSDSHCEDFISSGAAISIPEALRAWKFSIPAPALAVEWTSGRAVILPKAFSAQVNFVFPFPASSRRRVSSRCGTLWGAGHNAINSQDRELQNPRRQHLNDGSGAHEFSPLKSADPTGSLVGAGDASSRRHSPCTRRMARWRLRLRRNFPHLRLPPNPSRPPFRPPRSSGVLRQRKTRCSARSWGTRSYQKSVKLEEIGPGQQAHRPARNYHAGLTITPDGKLYQKPLRRPPSTLQYMDIERGRFRFDRRGDPLFPLTTAQLPKYQITFGREATAR